MLRIPVSCIYRRLSQLFHIWQFSNCVSSKFFVQNPQSDSNDPIFLQKPTVLRIWEVAGMSCFVVLFINTLTEMRFLREVFSTWGFLYVRFSQKFILNDCRINCGYLVFFFQNSCRMIEQTCSSRDVLFWTSDIKSFVFWKICNSGRLVIRNFRKKLSLSLSCFSWRLCGAFRLHSDPSQIHGGKNWWTVLELLVVLVVFCRKVWIFFHVLHLINSFLCHSGSLRDKSFFTLNCAKQDCFGACQYLISLSPVRTTFSVEFFSTSKDFKIKSEVWSPGDKTLQFFSFTEVYAKNSFGSVFYCAQDYTQTCIIHKQCLNFTKVAVDLPSHLNQLFDSNIKECRTTFPVVSALPTNSLLWNLW